MFYPFYLNLCLCFLYHFALVRVVFSLFYLSLVHHETPPSIALIPSESVARDQSVVM